MRGEIVGINGQISTRSGLRSNTGLGFAISARQIRLWLPRLEAAGGDEVKHARLAGLQFESADRVLPESVTVREVAAGSPADEAGFRAGDVITALDGSAVPNAARFQGLLGIYPDGQRVPVAVRREGGEATLDVLLTAPQRCRVGIDLVRQRGADLSVRVESVEEGSAAAAAGIRAGDEIVSFAGRRLQFSDRRQLKAFDRALRTSINVGDIVPLTVRRAAEEGGSTEIELRLVAR